MVSKRIGSFFRREAVLCIAAVCALASMLAVPPSGAYGNYVDGRVLGLLWSLMTVVAGLRRCGVFETLARQLTDGAPGGRRLGVILVALPFFTSMAVTNDVALLTFVPFTLTLLERLHCRRQAAAVVVLQTLAANLGSMATPVGNPQNLYLYAAYELRAGAFFSTIAMPTVLSFALLMAAARIVLPRELPGRKIGPQPQAVPGAGIRLTLYGALFALCLLSVVRILPWPAAAIAVALGTAAVDRRALLDADYGLLATFLCFFIFSGNLGAMPAVHTALQALLAHGTLKTAVCASQIISNVPAAVLLSGFTDDWRGLVLGTNIGGLGTPVASLASLISLKCYLRSTGARPGRFLVLFTGANLAGLAILLSAQALL